MSVLNPQTGDIFSVRIYKTMINNASLKWANTYEIIYGSTGGTSALDTALYTITQFEQAIHTDSVRITYGIISTWVPDGEPYNANEFIRKDFNVPGSIASPYGIEPLQTCLRVSFGVVAGRTGYRLYRGCLEAGTISAPSGTPSLTDHALISNRVTDAVETSSLEFYLGDAPGETKLVLHSLTNTRTVQGILVSGVTIKALNNKWFDKGTN